MFLGIVFFVLCIWILISLVFWSIRNGIGPMPSSFKAKACLMKCMPDVGAGKILELGSGWGTLAFPIARKFPGSHVIGYETSPIPFAFSRLWNWLCAYPNLQFQRRDFYSVSLKDADLIVCYLYPDAMRLLRAKLEKELKPGTWVISNTFAMPGWTPQKIFEVEDLYRTKIYLYKIDKLKLLL